MTQAHTTGSLATLLAAELDGPADLPIDRLERLEDAGQGAMTFIRSAKYAGAWRDSGASAALVSRGVDVPDHDPARRALLIVDDADVALTAALELFAPPTSAPPPGVHPTAVVSSGAAIDPSASIGAHAVIGEATIGARATIGHACVIGDGAHIGDDVTIHPGCVVHDRCIIGERSILHSGVVIGADGFGYHPAPDGSGLVKIPHIGDVRIGADVEIGANSCVDRAKLGSTTIGDGTKIDNLVQIGHNCLIGASCVICGHVGVSGSVTIGDGSMIGGGVGIADNLTLGAGAQIAASSGVICDIPDGEMWGGTPALPMRVSAQNYAAFRTLAQQLRELKKLTKRVDKLEGGS